MIVTPEILKLPSDWQAVPASEHLTLESGQRPSQHVTDDPNDVPSWGGENITDDGFITLENQRFINREYFRTKGKGKVRVGDILVNKDGANTGKVAFVDSLPVAEVSVNEHVFIVRNKGEFDQRFLFDFLRSYLGQKQIKALIIGSAQPGLNTRFTKHVLLPKTDIDEQRRIGRLFVEIDSAITAARQSITTTEGLQKGLMQRLLTGRLKPDGTRRLASEFWTHPKAGLVSKGWEVSPLKRLAEIQRGKFSHRPRNEPRFFGGPYPFIQTADIVASRGYIRQHSQILSEEGRVISRMFPRGTIMITIAANIGDTAILAYDMFATDSVIGITPKENCVCVCGKGSWNECPLSRLKPTSIIATCAHCSLRTR